MQEHGRGAKCVTSAEPSFVVSKRDKFQARPHPEEHGQPAELGLEHLQEARTFGAARDAREDADEHTPPLP